MTAHCRAMPSGDREQAPSFDRVNVDTCYWSRDLPDLGLVCDLSMPFRIYVLACQPQSPDGPQTCYVGITHRSQVARRIAAHGGQWPSSAHFTKTHAPLAIMGVWPAPNRAAEAYTFYALAAARTATALARGRLGGWTHPAAPVRPCDRGSQGLAHPAGPARARLVAAGGCP